MQGRRKTGQRICTNVLDKSKEIVKASGSHSNNEENNHYEIKFNDQILSNPKPFAQFSYHYWQVSKNISSQNLLFWIKRKAQ